MKCIFHYVASCERYIIGGEGAYRGILPKQLRNFLDDFSIFAPCGTHNTGNVSQSFQQFLKGKNVLITVEALKGKRCGAYSRNCRIIYLHWNLILEFAELGLSSPKHASNTKLKRIRDCLQPNNRVFYLAYAGLMYSYWAYINRPIWKTFDVLSLKDGLDTIRSIIQFLKGGLDHEVPIAYMTSESKRLFPPEVWNDLREDRVLFSEMFGNDLLAGKVGDCSLNINLYGELNGKLKEIYKRVLWKLEKDWNEVLDVAPTESENSLNVLFSNTVSERIFGILKDASQSSNLTDSNLCYRTMLTYNDSVEWLKEQEDGPQIVEEAHSRRRKARKEASQHDADHKRLKYHGELGLPDEE